MPTLTSDMTNLSDFMFSYDLNYYYNHDYIPNQELVFQTIDYFEHSDGKAFCKPLDFLNLLYWHYKFISENLNKPYDVISQIEKLSATEAGKHILIAFLIKWYGGYPVNNLNPKYNTILKLLEKKYLQTKTSVYGARQEEVNRGLSGDGFDQGKINELEDEVNFVNNLDIIIKIPLKEHENDLLSQAPTSPVDSSAELKTIIATLKTKNKELNTKLLQKSAVAWFKNYGMWFAIISAAFLFGFSFGNYKFDAEKLRLNALVDRQTKSLDSIRSIKKIGSFK